MDTTPLITAPLISAPVAYPTCWFCESEAHAECRCKRSYCDQHHYEKHCLVCALGLNLFEQNDEREPLSDLLVLSLAAASKDPYVVTPAHLVGAQPLPISGVERVLGAMMRMIKSGDWPLKHRAAMVLASTTVSLPTMDPSQLTRHNYGTGLLAADQVRAWLLRTLKMSRTLANEATAVAVLDKLRVADFREIYPSIVEKLTQLKISSVGTCVHDMVTGLDKIYPTNSYAINERCELFVYEQYINTQRGAGAMMQRMYGPRLRYAPVLAKMLKKGVWHSSYDRFTAWYPGEDEPY
jgi:hypothetical protein